MNVPSAASHNCFHSEGRLSEVRVAAPQLQQRRSSKPSWAEEVTKRRPKSHSRMSSTSKGWVGWVPKTAAQSGKFIGNMNVPSAASHNCFHSEGRLSEVRVAAPQLQQRRSSKPSWAEEVTKRRPKSHSRMSSTSIPSRRPLQPFAAARAVIS